GFQVASMAGLLACGSRRFRTFPSPDVSGDSGNHGKAHRLQLRGQPRLCALMGTSHRVPYYFPLDATAGKPNDAVFMRWAGGGVNGTGRDASAGSLEAFMF